MDLIKSQGFVFLKNFLKREKGKNPMSFYFEKFKKFLWWTPNFLK